ncbi:MAG: porin [Rikenellaceae bacterium]|nr:porin [Rikenellaceae bacterium]
MKRVLLLLVMAVSALAIPKAQAQDSGSYTPHVVVLGLYKHHPSCRDTVERQASQMAAIIFDRNHIEGIKQIGRPNLIFTSHNNKISLAVGGSVTLRAGYDFEGISNNTDFIPADISTTMTYANRQKLFMSASTSTLHLKAIAHTRLLGDVVAFIETDFRGYRNDMAMRQAYISFKGFLFGRTYSTFCDLSAGPNTIDFQGPNAYNSNYNEVIRYTHKFNRHWSIAAAAETPGVVATYATDNNAAQTQRIPDFVAYVQYGWGRYQKSHLRVSGVVRTMYYRDLIKDDNQKQVGYGVQLSGNIAFARHFNICMNGVYGKGITPYLQDLTGSGLDLVPNPKTEGEMQMPTMWGWFASLQYNITPRIFVSGGYSEVNVDHSNGYSVGGEYKKGQYIFANIFYNLAPNCRIALEYLYGTRKNQDGAKGHANRIQTMIQYKF